MDGNDLEYHPETLAEQSDTHPENNPKISLESDEILASQLVETPLASGEHLDGNHNEIPGEKSLDSLHETLLETLIETRLENPNEKSFEEKSRDKMHDEKQPLIGDFNSTNDTEEDCKVVVANLAFDTNSSQLTQFMSSVGHVVSGSVHVTSTGSSKGVGSVIYASKEAAQESLGFNGVEFMGRSLIVRKEGHHTSGAVQGRQLFISNLVYSVSRDQLMKHFRSIGPIENIEVYDGGTGTVCFEAKRDCERALADFDGTQFEGRRLHLKYDRKYAGAPQSHRGRSSNSFSRGRGDRRTPYSRDSHSRSGRDSYRPHSRSDQHYSDRYDQRRDSFYPMPFYPPQPRYFSNQPQTMYPMHPMNPSMNPLMNPLMNPSMNSSMNPPMKHGDYPSNTFPQGQMPRYPQPSYQPHFHNQTAPFPGYQQQQQQPFPQFQGPFQGQGYNQQPMGQFSPSPIPRGQTTTRGRPPRPSHSQPSRYY